MPLTSDRMIAIINAGLAFHDALETAQSLCTQQYNSVRNGGDATQAIEFLRTMLSPEALVNFNAGDNSELTYTKVYFALKSEEQHFREFASRNARMRRYRARRRGESPPSASEEAAPSGAAPSALPSPLPIGNTLSSSADNYTDEDA